MATSEASGGGSVGRIRDRLLDTLELRLELLGVELREQKDRLLSVLLAVLAAALTLFMAFFSLNLLLVVSLWEHRVLVAALLLALYLPASVLLVVWARRRIHASPVPFSESLAQLREDRKIFRSGP